MDTVSLRAPSKQIRDFLIFNVSNVSRCVTAANNICKSVDVFNKHDISIEDTFYFA
jgi:hypothetical protein